MFSVFVICAKHYCIASYTDIVSVHMHSWFHVLVVLTLSPADACTGHTNSACMFPCMIHMHGVAQYVLRCAAQLRCFPSTYPLADVQHPLRCCPILTGLDLMSVWCICMQLPSNVSGSGPNQLVHLCKPVHACFNNVKAPGMDQSAA